MVFEKKIKSTGSKNVVFECVCPSTGTGFAACHGDIRYDSVAIQSSRKGGCRSTATSSRASGIVRTQKVGGAQCESRHFQTKRDEGWGRVKIDFDWLLCEKGWSGADCSIGNSRCRTAVQRVGRFA